MESSIDFKEIFENYNLNLLKKLRGFGENKEFEFLKFWVPEENKFKSLLNLLIVISEQKISNIRFKIDKNFVKEDQILFDKILNKKFLGLSLFSNKNYYFVECKEILENDIKILQDIFLENYQEAEVNLNFEKKIDFKEANSKFNKRLLSVEKSKDFISFKQKKNFCIDDISKIKSNSHQIKITENIDGFKFLFLINKNDLTIEHCCYEKAKDSNLEKYIDLFFSKIIGENLIEAREHGVLKIEDDIFKKESSNGIRISQFIFTEISFLKKVIQKMFLKLQINDNNAINKTYRSISDKWKKKDDNEKKELISHEIRKFMKTLNINFNFILRNIEDHHRIYLNIEVGEKNESLKPSIFFELEKFLKKNVEFSIEIFNIEKIDGNKLRLKNSPQTQ